MRFSIALEQMSFIPSTTLTLLSILCTASCTFRSSIDGDGNVTIRKPNPVMRIHGIHEFKHLKRTKKTSTDPRYTERVDRVATRLKKVINMPDAEWEFVVFKDNSPNAFCLPGGKVGINTGLFRITKNDDALLAAVLGHEISHATANHAEQRMYRALGTVLVGALLWHAMDNNDINHSGEALAAYALGAYLTDSLPISRLQEHESDKMGAVFMAQAGYDPRKSVLLWRMLKSYHFQHGGQKPEFLRTHPHDQARISALMDFMPVAMRHYRHALSKKK